MIKAGNILKWPTAADGPPEAAVEVIARVRLRTISSRIGFAILVGLTAYLLYPTSWPITWFTIYCVMQMADFMVFSHILIPENRIHWRRYEWRLLASLILNVATFSSLSIYLWTLGGTEGKVFAAITMCCTTMNVVLSLYSCKRYLVACLTPHAIYLLGLPLVQLLQSPADRMMPLIMVIASIVIYLCYLILALKKLNFSMAEMQRVNEVARSAQYAAEEASTAKTNFLAVVTHEIRTPMNAIVSAVNFLRRTQLDDIQTAHLEMLSEANKVLLGLLNDVLDLSKIEAGKMTLERASIDLPDLVQNLEAMFQPLAAEKGLELKIVMARDIEKYIVSDPLRVRQILFNLLSNAVKFTLKGSIWLRMRKTPGSDGGQLTFEVEDEGIGIDAANLERIFNGFEQGEAGITRRYGGTGLGLSISRKLARMMKGDIVVRSKPGEGSCFYLTLPYDTAVDIPQPPALTPSDTASGADDTSIHVLIVDDHEVNRRIVSLFLEPRGWKWTMAEHGAEAVTLCQTRRFDVILMDMQMPVLDGIAATRHIRGHNGPNRMTPIIALTANAMDYHKTAWAEVGIHDFLTKPIEPEMLIATLVAKTAKPGGAQRLTSKLPPLRKSISS